MGVKGLTSLLAEIGQVEPQNLCGLITDTRREIWIDAAAVLYAEFDNVGLVESTLPTYTVS